MRSQHNGTMLLRRAPATDLHRTRSIGDDMEKRACRNVESSDLDIPRFANQMAFTQAVHAWRQEMTHPEILKSQHGAQQQKGSVIVSHLTANLA